MLGMRIVVHKQVYDNVAIDRLGFGMDGKANLGAKGKNSDGAKNTVALMR